TEEAIACREWASNLRRKGTLVTIPSIVVYECRRKLLHLGTNKGLEKLEETVSIFGRLQITDEVLDRAAYMWATLKRGLGKGGVDTEKIDADVIICAEATIFAIKENVAVTVATDNTRHFLPLVDGTHLIGATEWRNIAP
ncbi:MAG TPA: hypothetical protein PK867_11630, partial [Pirellulales bacterium]|nr:hypothetical protein [Pirellulales bacterium]